MSDHSGAHASAPTHSEAPATAHTHTETSALLHSHDPAPPAYTQHHDDHSIKQGHQHHHHHHHHHHGHGHQPNDSDEPTVEVSGTTMTYPDRRHGTVRKDESSSTRFRGVFSRIASALFIIVFAGYFFYSWNQARSAIPGNGLWSSEMVDDELNTIYINEAQSIEDRVFAILSSTPLIDGHNDLAIYIRGYYKNNITSYDFRSGFEHDGLSDNVDLPRLRSGQSGGAFWSAFVTCPPNASYDMSNTNYANAASETLEQIDLLQRLQAQYPRDFTPPTSTAMDPSGRERMILQWHAMHSLFGPISIEGLHQIPPSSPFSTLRLYYALGVRMATLTWNCHNPFADASLVMNSNNWTQPPDVVNGIFRPDEGAVTTRGKQVLREMNRLGMIIDISHTSYWTQKAVLSGTNTDGTRISRAPVVFSHSSAYTLCPHPRNVRDDILDLVPQSKSLVMVNFSPGFISCVASSEELSSTTFPSSSSSPHFSLPTYVDKNSTLHQVARHIVYIGTRIGYSHVGIGSDFDGMGEPPRGLEGVDKYPDLVAELLRMGVSDSDARKVVGGNLLRVWRDVDGVAARMREEGVEAGVDEVVGL